MFNLFWPILVIVAANTLYNISAKLTPTHVHPFASFTISYFVATLLSILLFFITSENKNIISEIHKTNWTAVALGASVVALEFGFIYLYRVGWNISTGSLIANIALACVLLIVGVLIYKENVSLQQIIGMVLCFVGLYLVTK